MSGSLALHLLFFAVAGFIWNSEQARRAALPVELSASSERIWNVDFFAPRPVVKIPSRSVIQSPTQNTALPPSVATGEKHTNSLAATSPSRSPGHPEVSEYRPAPEYPEFAKRHGWTGTVIVVIQSDETGGVKTTALKQSSGYPVLDEAALDGVKRWHIGPSTQMEVPIVYRLTD